ncbi:MAG: zinc-ribbon domain-containing protein [Ignavibacteria bacterium]|nr:zinc-ribbon domain-containing protein [Ignavibacteria bacterium]
MEKSKSSKQAKGNLVTSSERMEEPRVVCSECGTENEEESSFCANCGVALSPARKCPQCDALILPGADICEACGAWLLEGQCKFCYAPLEEGAKFCAECGNPADGIPCPQCGNMSYFDFCKHCGIPLTPQARQSIEDLKRTIEAQGLLVPTEQTATLSRPSEERIELIKMKEYQNKVEKWQQKKSAEPLFHKGRADKLIDQAKEIQSQQTPSIQSDALEKLQQRNFKNNQEARRFFGALKVILPTIKITRKPIGWLCKAYDCLHPEGPQGCADPAPGGEWIFETETISTLEEVQI